MTLSRRDFLLAGLGLMAAGCVPTPPVVAQRPGPAWPQPLQRPRPTASGPPTRVAPAPRTDPTALPSVSPQIALLHAIPRAQWAKGAPIGDRLLPMQGITDITVHHEGWTTVWFNDASSTAARLDLIRRSHIERLHAGDIGYHFIIDRAGRVWEGRPLTYQGAHVKEHNPHNLGVMCLGNFDDQRPSDVQVNVLRETLNKLMKQYRVSVRKVHTHQELNPTRCPGVNLQPLVAVMRRDGRLG